MNWIASLLLIVMWSLVGAKLFSVVIVDRLYPQAENCPAYVLYPAIIISGPGVWSIFIIAMIMTLKERLEYEKFKKECDSAIDDWLGNAGCHKITSLEEQNKGTSREKWKYLQ